MSNAAYNPIKVPAGVDIKIDQQHVAVKGAKGMLELVVDKMLTVNYQDAVLSLAYRCDLYAREINPAMIGTTRSLINNMIKGVTEGYEIKLELVGVGYRAQVKGKAIALTLGLSHPVEYELPEGVTAETPSQTEIVLKSIDKQLIGQVAAEIRSYRPPEPYKGKGIRYAGERIKMKEGKKK